MASFGQASAIAGPRQRGQSHIGLERDADHLVVGRHHIILSGQAIARSLWLDAEAWSDYAARDQTRREHQQELLAPDSVRHAGGQGVAIFSPAGVRIPIERAGHVRYRWDPPR